MIDREQLKRQPRYTSTGLMLNTFEASCTQVYTRRAMEIDYIGFSVISTFQFYNPFLLKPSEIRLGLLWNYIDAFCSIGVGMQQLCMADSGIEPHFLDFHLLTTLKGMINCVSGMQSLVFASLTFQAGFLPGIYLGFVFSMFCDVCELLIDLYCAYHLKERCINFAIGQEDKSEEKQNERDIIKLYNELFANLIFKLTSLVGGILLATAALYGLPFLIGGGTLACASTGLYYIVKYAWKAYENIDLSKSCSGVCNFFSASPTKHGSESNLELTHYISTVPHC